MRRAYCGMALAAIVILALPPTVAMANMVVNGSFENGVDIPGGTYPTGGYLPLDGGDTTSITGWEILGKGRGKVDYIGELWAASDGKRSVDLDGSPGPGGVQQDIVTVPGTHYTVTFDMAGNPYHEAPYGQTAVKSMEVSAIGVATVSQVYDFDTTGNSFASMGWTGMQFTFVADAALTTLRFMSTSSGDLEDLYCGPALDNVSMDAVPVPGAVLLGILGLGTSSGLFAWGKRRTG